MDDNKGNNKEEIRNCREIGNCNMPYMRFIGSSRDDNMGGIRICGIPHMRFFGVPPISSLKNMKIDYNVRISCAPHHRRMNAILNKKGWMGYLNLPDPEITCDSVLQLDICSEPEPKPKPKLDIFVNFSDKICFSSPIHYFVAYSLEEDGTLSPKYYICIPTFISKPYSFTRAGCNGLFHFYDEESKSQLLWNPGGEHKELPKSFQPQDLHHDRLEFCHEFLDFTGMWYDHISKDYKVLNLVTALYMDEKQVPPMATAIQHIHLYSLHLNSWKKIPCPGLGWKNGAGLSSACIAGVFYFEAENKDTRAPVFLSFDFSTETLSSFTPPLPACEHYFFLEYKGSLSVLACWYEPFLNYQFIPYEYELWVMRDGEKKWTKESVFQTRGVRNPLWFSPDGKLLYFRSVEDLLVMFDRVTGKLKHLGIDLHSKDLRTHESMIPFFDESVQLN